MYGYTDCLQWIAQKENSSTMKRNGCTVHPPKVNKNTNHTQHWLKTETQTQLLRNIHSVHACKHVLINICTYTIHM